MIEQSIIIEVGGHQVLSELRYDESHPERTMIHITSSCGSHRAVNSLTIKHRMGYSPEQAAFDIEDARFRYAEALAGEGSALHAARAAGSCAGPSPGCQLP